jgi:predicted dehydrogenase
VVRRDDVDGVVIATPATTHFALARDALVAGKHVLCEKPLTMSVHECEELIRRADDAGCTLFVGHTFVYNPAVRAARDFVCRGELAPPLYAHAVWAAPGPVRHDVNALWDLAPHPVSILSYVLGRQPASVAATGQAILPASREDVVSLHLRFDEAASADLHLSWLAPQKVRTLTVTGARRIAIFDDMEPANKLRVFATAQATGSGVSGARGVPARKLALPNQPVDVPNIPAGEPLAAQLDHFIACCRRGLTPESDGMAGTNVVRVLEAAETSLREGGHPIAVESPLQFA